MQTERDYAGFYSHHQKAILKQHVVSLIQMLRSIPNPSVVHSTSFVTVASSSEKHPQGCNSSMYPKAI